MEQREKIEEIFAWADKKARPVIDEQNMSALEILCQRGAETQRRIKDRQMKAVSDFILNDLKQYNPKIQTVQFNPAPDTEKFLTLNFKTTGGFPMKCGIDTKAGCCLIDGLLGGVNGISVFKEKTSFSVFEENLLKPVLMKLAEKWLAQFNIMMDADVKITVEMPGKKALFFDVKTHQNTGHFFWLWPDEVKNALAAAGYAKFGKQMLMRHIDLTERFYTQSETCVLRDVLSWEKGKKIMFKTQKTTSFVADKKANTGILKENNKKVSIVLETTDFA